MLDSDPDLALKATLILDCSQSNAPNLLMVLIIVAASLNAVYGLCQEDQYIDQL